MIRCRGMRFRDEDDAYEYFEQRELDDAAAQHQEELLRQQQQESEK